MGYFIPLSFEERQQIEKLLKEGYSIKQIHKKMNRSYHGISAEIKKNGGRENYLAIEGQKNVRMSRKKPLKETEKVMPIKDEETHLHKIENYDFGSKVNEYIKRIENLEMQMDILINQIRELSK